MTHLLQQLDLTKNGSLKKFGKKNFSEYFLSSVLKELKNDPTCDVTLIKVGLYLFTLKPLYAEVMKNAYNYFASCRGKEAGSKASGITNTIHKTRIRQVNVIYLNLFTYCIEIIFTNGSLKKLEKHTKFSLIYLLY